MGLVSSPCSGCDFFEEGKVCKERRNCINEPGGKIFKIQEQLSELENLSPLNQEGKSGVARYRPGGHAFWS